ncbi:MAG: hypothetical protein ACJASB_003169 [Shewanella psychromarinicola]|jgi:hypothetical protein
MQLQQIIPAIFVITVKDIKRVSKDKLKKLRSVSLVGSGNGYQVKGSGYLRY